MTPRAKKQAELLHSDVSGRLTAICVLTESVVDGHHEISDLYGIDLSIQELQLRVAEMALKLLLVCCGTKVPRDHGLNRLWNTLPDYIRTDVADEYRTMTHGEFGDLGFHKYEKNDFQRSRYPHEYLADGEFLTVENHYAIELWTWAALQIATKWLGGIPILPWAGLVDTVIDRCHVSRLDGNKFMVSVQDVQENEKPIDVRWAYVRYENDKYNWRLVYGVYDEHGVIHTFWPPTDTYMAPPSELIDDTLGMAVAKVAHAYRNPEVGLQKFMDSAKGTTERSIDGEKEEVVDGLV